jgi:hypothetical protein
MKKAAVILLFLGLFAVVAYSVTQRSNYSSNNPILHQIRDNFSKIDPKYAKIPLKEGDSAYTENKEVITLCLVNPETKREYDINTLTYVALHELAHVISKSTGHGPEFKENFSKLLKRGSELGIYDPKLPIPANYCNVKAHE